MATIVNKAPVFGLSGATLVFMDQAYPTTGAVTGYVSPNLTDCSLTHTFQLDKSAGQDGGTSMFIGSDEKLELSVSFILQGSTIADAKKSGRLPLPLAEVQITGAAVVTVGNFADAFNTVALAPRWIYEGGGSIEMTSTGKAVGKMTLHKYIGITAATLPALVA